MENSDDDDDESKESLPEPGTINKIIQNGKDKHICVPVNRRTERDDILSKVEDIEKRINDMKKVVVKRVQAVSHEREHLLQQIESVTKGINYEDLSGTQTDKSLRFNQEGKEKEINIKLQQKSKRFKRTVDKGNTDNIRNMLTTLDSKQEEIVRKNKQIEHLKMRKASIYEDTGQLSETEKDAYEKKINSLEEEKNKLHEELIDYIIHHVVENKQEYEKTITELEEENNEMSDLVYHFHVVTRTLKDFNLSLQFENKILKENNERLMHGESIDDSQLHAEHAIRSEFSLKSTMSWLHEQAVLDKFIEQGIQDRDDMSGSMSVSVTASFDEEVKKDKVIDLRKRDELHKRLSLEHHIMEMTEYKMRILKERVMREGMRIIEFLGSVDPRHHKSVTNIMSKDS